MESIKFEPGMMVICGLYYQHNGVEKKCVVSGNPMSFNSMYFTQEV